VVAMVIGTTVLTPPALKWSLGRRRAAVVPAARLASVAPEESGP